LKFELKGKNLKGGWVKFFTENIQDIYSVTCINGGISLRYMRYMRHVVCMRGEKCAQNENTGRFMERK